jgi:hypothetical protein
MSAASVAKRALWWRACPGLPSPPLGTIFRCTIIYSTLDASHVPVELSEKHHAQGYGGQSQGSMLCVNMQFVDGSGGDSHWRISSCRCPNRRRCSSRPYWFLRRYAQWTHKICRPLCFLQLLLRDDTKELRTVGSRRGAAYLCQRSFLCESP